jgi:cell division protein ZapA (FtsZ GTPase activity inhibitor)
VLADGNVESLEHLVTIELFGQPYTFKADTEAELAEEIAGVLTREVQKVQNQQAGQAVHIPKLTILIIAALNIANRIVELKKDTSEFVDKISERYEGLNRMLDEGLNRFQSVRFMSHPNSA